MDVERCVEREGGIERRREGETDRQRDKHKDTQMREEEKERRTDREMNIKTQTARATGEGHGQASARPPKGAAPASRPRALAASGRVRGSSRLRPPAREHHVTSQSPPYVFRELLFFFFFALSPVYSQFALFSFSSLVIPHLAQFPVVSFSFPLTSLFTQTNSSLLPRSSIFPFVFLLPNFCSSSPFLALPFIIQFPIFLLSLNFPLIFLSPFTHPYPIPAHLLFSCSPS